MIGRKGVFAAVASAMLWLAGCGEKVQTMEASARNADAQPWTASSAAEPAFAATGWTGGDRAAWEAHIRRRNQAQNDFVR